METAISLTTLDNLHNKTLRAYGVATGEDKAILSGRLDILDELINRILAKSDLMGDDDLPTISLSELDSIQDKANYEFDITMCEAKHSVYGKLEVLAELIRMI